MNKPFSDYQRSSNLSPYLNLGGFPTSSVPNYYSLVRPELELQQRMGQDRQTQARQQREISRLQEVQSQAARAPFNIQGAADIAPTGHAAVFQNLSGRFLNYGGYYNQPRR